VPTRIEKIVVPMLLAKIDHPPSGLDHDAGVGGSACKEPRRRPDTVWCWKDRIVSIEIDEGGGHPDREPSCEIDKMQGQASSWYKLLGGTIVPVFYVRFNPDESGCYTKMEARVEAVADRVNSLLKMSLEGVDCLRLHVWYYFYHTKCQKHVDATTALTGSFVVHC
jgi:hypothetical protein